MTSSNLKQEGGRDGCSRRPFPAMLALLLTFAFALEANALEAAPRMVCGAPGLDGSDVVAVRCRPEFAQGATVWTMQTEGLQRTCGAVPQGTRLPDGAGAACGVVGEEVWFWRRLDRPERGGLRYRSWAREGAWYLDGATVLPEALEAGGRLVGEARWSDGGPTRPFALLRSRLWLGGEVVASSDGLVTLVAEPGVAAFSDRVLATLKALRSRGWGEEVGEVVLIEATRRDYGSGRSVPGQIVLEVGSALSSARVAELVQHEVAHQLVGGAIRVLASGRDVGWFLEGFAEYLGFAALRDDAGGRAALFRRFAEACATMGEGSEAASDYDVGFLYGAAVDGALWRSQGITLADRLRSLRSPDGRAVVFTDREDFLGMEARSDFAAALLAGVPQAEAATLRRWFERSERPEVTALAKALGVTLATERVAWAGLPVVMQERRDGLFDVQAAPGGGLGLGLRAGDVVWPLAPWSGPAIAAQVPIEVQAGAAWQVVKVPTVRGWRQRLRVATIEGVEQRWFGAFKGVEP